MHHTSTERLFRLAEPQHGYFTAAQAKNIGFEPTRLPVMANRGHIERISRGVYRLPHFPESAFSSYMEAVLWPHDSRGIVSHASALSFHGLSDVSPAQMHITLPRAYRVRRSIPRHLEIHHADLEPHDYQVLDGIPVTNPVRSILDAHDAHLPSALIRQAVEDGMKSGKLTALDTDALQERLGIVVSTQSTAMSGR